MSITSHIYTLALTKSASNALFNSSWTADTINCALTSGYTPAQDTDSFWSTPQTSEITGTGYTAGGVTLGSKSIGAVTGSHEIPLIAGNAVWTTASFSCTYAVVYRSTGTASTSPLIGWVNFGGTETVASGTFTITFDPTNGVVALTAS